MKYRTFGNSGLRVSELCLGTMTFGEAWGWGASKNESRKIFDAFTEAGGNFIDTANVYTNGESETFLGEFIQSERDHLVIASKYSYMIRENDPNAAGNHRKSLVQAVDGILDRLDTEYLDLLWVHAWDKLTPAEEVLMALNDLIGRGKVLYIGISDTPAWFISKSNTMAGFRGWNAYAGVQLEYSLIRRSAERDLIPMARHEGLGITAWGPLAAGLLTGKYNTNNEGKRRIDNAEDLYGGLLSERNLEIASRVVDIANESGLTPPQVALQWIRQSQPGIIPVIGARTVDQLEENLAILRSSLDQSAMELLDETSRIEQGFPHDFLNSEAVRYLNYAGKADQILNLK